MIEGVRSDLLGARVNGLRRERGLTLDALAESSGVSRAMISKLEHGEKNPTLVIAAKLAEGLSVTLSQLVGIEERREVVVVPKEKRMVMQDPETGFERQLLSPAFGSCGVEFIRNVVPEGSTSGEFPTAPERRGGTYRSREGQVESRTRQGRSTCWKRATACTSRPIYLICFDNAGDGECSYYLVISSRGA